MTIFGRRLYLDTPVEFGPCLHLWDLKVSIQHGLSSTYADLLSSL